MEYKTKHKDKIQKFTTHCLVIRTAIKSLLFRTWISFPLFASSYFEVIPTIPAFPKQPFSWH